MNLPHSSQLNQNFDSSISPVESFNSKLKRIRSFKTLQTHQKALQFLALDFDPFSGEMSDEAKQVLKNYQLEALVNDPFQFTNTLLQLLDLLEERIKTHIH